MLRVVHGLPHLDLLLLVLLPTTRAIKSGTSITRTRGRQVEKIHKDRNSCEDTQRSKQLRRYIKIETTTPENPRGKQPVTGNRCGSSLHGRSTTTKTPHTAEPPHPRPARRPTHQDTFCFVLVFTTKKEVSLTRGNALNLNIQRTHHTALRGNMPV